MGGGFGAARGSVSEETDDFVASSGFVSLGHDPGCFPLPPQTGRNHAEAIKASADIAGEELIRKAVAHDLILWALESDFV